MPGNDILCLRGAKEICLAVGENYKDIGWLVENEGLPAFRRFDNGVWKARPAALRKWLAEQEKKYLQ